MPHFDSDVLIPLFIFAIPIIAVTGGIIIAIVRALSRQRMIELVQRERIAAIERGIDPAKLPPVDLVRLEPEDLGRRGEPLRFAQNLLIGGLVVTGAGLGIAVFLHLIVAGGDHPVWAVGLIPTFVGVALLISAAIVWPRKNVELPRV